MSRAAGYCAVEQLRDGRQMMIRALRSDDRDDMLAAIERTSMRSMRHLIALAREAGAFGCASQIDTYQGCQRAEWRDQDVRIASRDLTTLSGATGRRP